MMRLENLCCGYGGAACVRGISSAFGAGQITGLIGPNGCRKIDAHQDGGRTFAADQRPNPARWAAAGKARCPEIGADDFVYAADAHCAFDHGAPIGGARAIPTPWLFALADKGRSGDDRPVHGTDGHIALFRCAADAAVRRRAPAGVFLHAAGAGYAAGFSR